MSYMTAFATALTASLLLTVVVRSVAIRLGIVDRPDGQRKLHGRPIPLWGGAAVYGAAVLGLLALRWSSFGADAQLVELSNAWMIAAGFVCCVGGIDDRFDLPARLKLLLQICAVLPIVMLGYYVDRIVAFGYPIELGWLGVPLTVLWLVGCINALNLMDGMDGLASIVGVSTAAMTGVIAASQGFDHVAAMAAVLTASLLGFLAYNLPPASIFLGDSGSMVIGLSVGLLGIQGTTKTSTTLAITAPAVVMALPMLDTLAALVRRKLTGRPFDSPDRLHIHHRLLDRGWNPWQVLCLVGAVCLTTGAAATAATIFRRDALAWITVMTLLVLMIRLRLFGHEEFALIKGFVSEKIHGYGAGILHAASVLGRLSQSSERPASAYKPRALISELRLPAPAMWSILLHDVQAWDVCLVELQWRRGGQRRRIRWLDSSVSNPEMCRWSLVVSQPGVGDDFCELCVSRDHSFDHTSDLDALTALLKTYSGYFAVHGEQLFGPSPPTETIDDQHRKAA